MTKHMKEKQLFLVTTFTELIVFNLARVIGWKYFAQTKLWQTIVYDNVHHYQLGILLLIGVYFFKKLGKVRTIVSALGIGMIIDESMYLFYFLDKRFSHGTVTGIIFEFLIFAVLYLIVFNFERIKSLIKTK